VGEAVLSQFVSSESYARAMRELLDSYLTTSPALRELVQTTMSEALAHFMSAPDTGGSSLLDRFDPSGLWRAMSTVNLQAWSRLFTTTIFRQALETTMTEALIQLNMPTRSDITSLVARLEQLEMRLNDIEAKLDRAVGRRSSASAGSRSEPKEEAS
jgi:hypothetical protein